MNWEQFFYIAGIIFFGVNLFWWVGILVIGLSFWQKMKKWQQQIELERQIQAKKAATGARWLWLLVEMYHDWKRIKNDGRGQ